LNWLPSRDKKEKKKEEDIRDGEDMFPVFFVLK
jgi:hypothetical protein